MSATMVRKGGRVQWEQSNMRQGLNMVKMAEGGFSCTAIEKTLELIMQPHTEFLQEKQWEVEFPVHQLVKAVIERHPAMVYTNHTAGFLLGWNGTAKNPQTRWRRKGTNLCLPKLAANLPGMPTPSAMPPVLPGDTNRFESYDIDGKPSRCVYIHDSPLPNTQYFNHDAYAKDSKRHTAFIPDLLSTQFAVWKYCWHSFWRGEQPFEWIREWRQALSERTGIHEYYHYL
jgi:hypothetical protein